MCVLCWTCSKVPTEPYYNMPIETLDQILLFVGFGLQHDLVRTKVCTICILFFQELMKKSNKKSFRVHFTWQESEAKG